MIVDEQSYLAHHGVKGMKWGVRRARDPVTGKKRPRTREEKIALAAKTVKVASVAIAGGVIAAKILRELNGAKTPRPQLKIHNGESDKWLRQNFLPDKGKTPVSHIKPPERVFAMGPGPSRRLKTPVRSEMSFIKTATKKHNTDALVENARLRKWYDDFKIPIPDREFVELWPE